MVALFDLPITNVKITSDDKEIAFLKAMHERLYADKFYGVADYYGLQLEKLGCTYSKGVVE